MTFVNAFLDLSHDYSLSLKKGKKSFPLGLKSIPKTKPFELRLINNNINCKSGVLPPQNLNNISIPSIQ